MNQSCLLYRLPNEIMQDGVMSLLPQRDLASLHRTSKLLCDLTTRPAALALSMHRFGRRALPNELMLRQFDRYY
jgi:hypothetical protein